MEIKFSELTFKVGRDGDVRLDSFGGFDAKGGAGPLCEVDVSGGNTSGALLMNGSDEAKKLKYRTHKVENGALTLIQESESLRVTSCFHSYPDTGAIRITQTVKNISGTDKTLTLVGTVGLYFGEKDAADPKAWYFHRFSNYRYSECMPKISSFAELGLYYIYGSFHYENIGNQSTTEYLPLGIIEHRESGRYLGFQIESYAGWRYELSVRGGRYCLQLGGANSTYHDWKKTLKSGQEYTSVSACICLGGTVNEVAAELTRYRRHLRPKSKADEALPAIYNEYMHYSWDNPFASVTALTAPAVAESGCKYYVIDCGWQAGVAPKDATDGEVTDIVYRLFGTWQENRERFPDGIMKTAELVRSLGMKFGLWIAPEVVGVNNKEMLEYYGDDCFFKRNGEKIRHWSGYLLDFRHPRVYKYMSDSLSRMIEDYGCDYIKFDGCPKSGLGTETDGESLGDALEKAMDAFLSWVGDMMKKYPDVIFEDCAGGGQRTDYKALSMFHLLSTSDQMRYDHYPYIVGNVFCAVLPEQAGIWSYPVDSALFETEHPENTDGRVSAERVVINMVNAILGRIHLASRIHLLSSEKQALIKEGVEYYDSITSDKLSAVPYLPKGYTEFGDTFVSCGIKTDKKLYLAVWNLQGKRNVKLDLPEIEPKSVRVAYPSAPMGDFSVDLNGNTLDISFGCDEQARIIEIEL